MVLCIRSVVCCLCSVVYGLWSVIYGLLSMVCFQGSVVTGLLSMVCCLVSCLWSVACCPWSVVYSLLSPISLQESGQQADLDSPATTHPLEEGSWICPGLACRVSSQDCMGQDSYQVEGRPLVTWFVVCIWSVVCGLLDNVVTWYYHLGITKLNLVS